MKLTKIVVGLILFISCQSIFATCTITIGWELWEPYQFQDSEGQLTGMDIELSSYIAKQAGCQVQFIEQLWKRQLHGIKYGNLDAMLAASWTAERASFSTYLKPYRQEIMKLYVRTKDLGRYQMKSLSDFKNHPQFRLGVTRGYFYGDEFETFMKKNPFNLLFDDVKDVDLNFKKLKLDRIDGLVADAVVGTRAIQTWAGQEIAAANLVINDNDVHIITSKKSVNAAVVKQLNQAIEKIRQHPEYQAILKKYQGSQAL